MKTIPSALLADLKLDATALAFLWTIEMADGRMIRGTEHDRDIVIPQTGSDPFAGTFYAVANNTHGDIASTTDLSVDNLEVHGAIPVPGTDSPLPYTVLDVTVDDIESGLLDAAPVTIFVCNWKAPEHGYFIVKTGHLGAIKRDSDGLYTTEVRGLMQLLTQTVIRTYSATCNVVKFGDRRCKYPVGNITVSGTVNASITSDQSFSVALHTTSPPGPTYSFEGGALTFTSGANNGFSREVKLDPNQNGGVIEFWEEFPELVAQGDNFVLSPGCDRQSATCRVMYINFDNWRGFGLFIPGVLAITAGPTTAQEL